MADEYGDGLRPHGPAAGPSRLDETTMSACHLIGSSAKFRAALEDARIVAATDCAVLVRGETGTGKEEIARAIHELSPRRRNRFVAVNCSAIPAALLETELFGHERGPFTGAEAPRVGRFQAADKGTLFLDEIGELSLELQPKLLRALQQQEFERVGSSQPTRVDVRIVAATNQDLRAMVRQRHFRADLYYRLSVFPVTLPPLRERDGDIPLLATHFVETFARRQGKSIPRIPDEVMRVLEDYDWPGNIRELQNVIQRSVILSTGDELRAPTEEIRALRAGGVRTLADANRAHILATLRRTHGVVGGRDGAAARLGLKRTTLIAKMKKLGVSPERAHSGDEGVDESDEAPPRAVSGLA